MNEFRSALLTTQNPKLLKNPLGFLVLIVGLSLAAADAAIRGKTVCAMAGDCALTCLYEQGRGRFHKTQQARIRKTLEYWKDPGAFVAAYRYELQRALDFAEANEIPVVANRPNIYSDIAWEGRGLALPQSTPAIQHYDYTKIPKRARLSVTAKTWPANYYLTYSHNEKSDYGSHDLQGFLSNGGSVAMVFDGALPEVGSVYPFGRSAKRLTVVNGDEHDMRWKDPDSSLVALPWRASKAERKLKSRFVVRMDGNDINWGGTVFRRIA